MGSRKPKIGQSPHELGGPRTPRGHLPDDHRAPQQAVVPPQNSRHDRARAVDTVIPHGGSIGQVLASDGGLLQWRNPYAAGTRSTQEQTRLYQQYHGFPDTNTPAVPGQSSAVGIQRRINRDYGPPPADPQAFDEWYQKTYQQPLNTAPRIVTEYRSDRAEYVLTAHHGDGTTQSVSISERALHSAAPIAVAQMFEDAMRRIGAQSHQIGELFRTIGATSTRNPMAGDIIDAIKKARVDYRGTPDILDPESIKIERQEARLSLRGQARAVRNRG